MTAPRADGHGTVPCNIDAERAVLGCLLVDGRLLARATDLAPEAFFLARHQLVFSAVQEVAGLSAVTPVLVAERLHARKQLDAAGGPGYLAELVDDVGTTAMVEHHIDIVRRKARLRRIIDSATAMAHAAMAPDADADVVADAALAGILDATRAVSGRRYTRTLGDWCQVALDGIQRRFDGSDPIRRTGFEALDAKVTMAPGDLVIVAGRAAMGKTAFLMALADRAARQGRRVLEFQLEMGGEQMALRRVAHGAQTPVRVLRSERLHASQVGRVTSAMGELAGLPIVTNDRPSASPAYVASTAREVVAEHGSLDLVVVDYVQLMRTAEGRNITRDQAIGRITQALKDLAKELGVIVLAGAQVSRKVEERSDKRPTLADLRESGSIEQDADTILFVYRDEYYKRERSEFVGQAEIVIGKQRNGETGSVMLGFDGQYMRFFDLETGGSW